MPGNSTPGYSGTPLAKKLGVKEAHRIWLVDAPENYASLLEPLPAAVLFVGRADATVNIAHVFLTERDVLERQLNDLRGLLKPDAALWISWPKKASKVPTTVTEDTIRALALPLGFVDVKGCAVTEVWSGLKLVLRKELR
ncbi:DUF3052 domain-containing protein [Rhodoferax sp.]|uniref:DUF3052 domain-containing protein n=1 Tax=Rhodoferax sp. TaxID=50421 RepID=UPI0025E97C5D|nr:DUF3052 domain-containing protein [Rhodoferax sp.]